MATAAQPRLELIETLVAESKGRLSQRADKAPDRLYFDKQIAFRVFDPTTNPLKDSVRIEFWHLAFPEFERWRRHFQTSDGSLRVWRGAPTGAAEFRGTLAEGLEVARASLRSLMSGGKTIVPLRFVDSPESVRLAVATFNLGARKHGERTWELLRRTSYWVFDPDSGAFGPGKFVGFEGMTFEDYERALAGQFTGGGFDGHATRNAIEEALESPFVENEALKPALYRWAERLAGPAALDGLSHEKWAFLVLPSARRYWAILGNPTMYKIEEAVAALDEDTWMLPAGDPAPGDRLVFWKAKGKGTERGVVALGEVLEEPSVRPPHAASLPFFRDTADLTPTRRFLLRYVVPPRAPLWWTPATEGLLSALSVANAQGNKLYTVTPEQWTQLVDALGGWPDAQSVAMDEVLSEATDSATAELPTGSGQGYATSPARKKAVELCAMEAAKAWLAVEGWGVQDTSKNRPYDLVGTKGDSLLYVEVKGTTSAGESVFLTRNEVAHARAHPEASVLFIHQDIILTEGKDGPVASGGQSRVYRPWAIEDAHLTALQFAYDVPVGLGVAVAPSLKRAAG